MRGAKPTGRRAAIAAIRAIVLVLPMLVLAGCGFQLRGQAILPFESIAIPGVASPLLADLSRNIQAGTNAKVIQDNTAAQAQFALLQEVRDKVILSLTSQGRIREYQLRYIVAFRVTGKGGEYVPVTQLVLRRDISFNDQVLAKESEEQLLFREMQQDMVQQILRRMRVAKFRTPDDD